MQKESRIKVAFIWLAKVLLDPGLHIAKLASLIGLKYDFFARCKAAGPSFPSEWFLSSGFVHHGYIGHPVLHHAA